MIISVIVPTYKRASIIECLASIYAQKDAPEFEVIVVAREMPEEMYKALIKIYPHILILRPSTDILILRPCKDIIGNGPAKNYGVEWAKGTYLAFTDDDCIVDENWLNHLYYQAEIGYDIVAGNCLPYDIANPYLLAHQGAIMYHLNTQAFLKARVGTTMNLLIKKEIFDKLKGFDKLFASHYGDDYDFNIRWAADESIRAAYFPKAIVLHNHKLTLLKLIKLSFRYGIGLNLCRMLVQSRIIQKVASIGRLLDFSSSIQVCMPRLDYIKMFKYIAYRSADLATGSFLNRHYAGVLAIVMQEIKRLGVWYGSRHPEVVSKVYD